MSIPPAFRLVTPIDEEAPHRAVRHRELGIREEPDPEFDEFSRDLALQLNAPSGMINIIGPTQQYLVGLYPFAYDRGVSPESDPMRVLACEAGYCMYVVTRKRAMALDEVMDYHLFAGNPVVADLGTRAYLGAPLIDYDGEALGTICVIDFEPHKWGNQDIAFMKAKAAELVDRFHERANLLNGVG